MSILAASNAVVAAAAASGGTIDWTSLWQFLIVAVSAASTVIITSIKIFGNKISVKDEDIRGLPLIKENAEAIAEGKKKYEALKDSFNELHINVERLKLESQNNEKSTEEVKRDYRELVSRLDDLLKQLLEWVNN